MNTAYAESRRDRRLRKRLLQALYVVRVRPESGWVNGRFLYDLVDGALPGGEKFESDLHLLGLLRDLVNSRYAEERDDRRRRDEVFDLESASFRITAVGTAMALEAVDPDPLIEDSRLRR